MTDVLPLPKDVYCLGHGTCGSRFVESSGKRRVDLDLPETNQNAPENRLKPKRKRSYSNHPFSGAKMLVSGKLANSQSFDFVCVTGLVLVGSTQPFRCLSVIQEKTFSAPLSHLSCFVKSV